MSILIRLERSMGWAAFPGLIRYIALFQLFTLVLTFVAPAIPQQLDFNYERLLRGEVWRAFTFIFLPQGTLSSGGGLGVIFAVFAALLLMTFGDGLEQQWGTFGATMYVYLGWFTCLLSSLLAGFLNAEFLTAPAFFFDLSILFAFAVYFPKFEILLFLIIPVRISFIAILAVVILLLQFFSHPPLFLYAAGCLGNFLFFVGPNSLRGAKQRGTTLKRRAEMKSKSLPEHEAFHHCESCGATEHTHPEREFRIAPDGRELCSDCLAPTAPKTE